MSRPKTERLKGDAGGIARAAELLKDGGLVAVPTETVYGLAADATDAEAVARVFAAKDRPAFNPLIVHVPDLPAAERVALFDDTARALAGAFWPGPLTLVLPRRPGRLADLVTAGGPRVAVRVPDHPLAHAVLQAAGCPLAAPSANPSGRISPTTAEHVLAGLDGLIDAVLDGGACPVGVESTILGVDADGVSLLRAGGLPLEAIEEALGYKLAQAETKWKRPEAPGQLPSHYAPTARVRLDAVNAKPGEVMIGFGPVEGDLTLSASGDLVEAAARLFAVLHAADATRRPIAVAPVPDKGLGRAINDRLRRAAAPR